MRQLWPHIDKAVADIVHAQVKTQLATLGSLSIYGVSSVTLQQFALGPSPQIGGVKVWPADGVAPPGAVVMDIDLRVSGADSNALVYSHLLAGSPLVIQLAALQLRTVVRVCFRDLGPRLPPFGAVTVSLLGQPFVDFSLTALSGDIMALPGLESAVSAAVTKGVSGLLWPQRMIVPLASDTDLASLHPRATGVLLVRIKAARGLPITDAVDASTDPFVRVIVQNHSTVLETPHRKKTRAPTFNTFGMLPLIDAAHERLHIELWDENKVASDELVSTAELFIADALARARRTSSAAAIADGVAFCEWVPLTRRSIKVTDVSAGLSAAHSRVRSLVTTVDESAHHGGEVLLEFTHVPFEPPSGSSPVMRLPHGWSLPERQDVIIVRLLSASQLHPPPGWTSRMTPIVTVKLFDGQQRTTKRSFTSEPGTGPNCSWYQTFEFTECDVVEDDDEGADAPAVMRAQPAPVRLHFSLDAGQKQGIAGAITGAASGAVSIVTLGIVGGTRKSADSSASLRLHGASGGLLGRIPESDADATEDIHFDATTFCGRAVLDVRDVARKVRLSGEPHTMTLPLIDTVGGVITCVVDIRRLSAVGVGDEEAAQQMAVTEGDGAPYEARAEQTAVAPAASLPSASAGATQRVMPRASEVSRPRQSKRSVLGSCCGGNGDDL